MRRKKRNQRFVATPDRSAECTLCISRRRNTPRAINFNRLYSALRWLPSLTLVVPSAIDRATTSIPSLPFLFSHKLTRRSDRERQRSRRLTPFANSTSIIASLGRPRTFRVSLILQRVLTRPRVIVVFYRVFYLSQALDVLSRARLRVREQR